jgi:hypothetical protein
MSLASNHPIAGTIYELLTNQEDARACRDIPDTACRVSPTNFVVLLASYFLSKLGDAIANPKTVLTWVMTSVGAPLWMLGFLVPIRESGSLIPQLVIASYVRRMPVRKWVWVAGSALQGLCMLGIGLFTITLTGATAGAAILGLLVAFSLARGLCSVAAKDVLGKTIPKGRRGQLTGWSASAAGLITVGLGSALLVVEPGADANRLYGFALVGAAVLWGLAALTFSFAREFRGATDGGADALREAVQRLSILVDDRPFRHFVITRSLLLCSALTAPYFVALGQANLGGDTRVLALFVIASGVASLVSAPVWGRYTDRSSRRVMVFAAMLTAAIGTTVALASWLAPGFAHTLWFLPGAYFLLAIAHAGVRVGRKTYVVDLAGGNKRTDYVAVSNTVIGVVLLATGLVGTVAAVISLPVVIALLSLMGGLGAVYAWRLPET